METNNKGKIKTIDLSVMSREELEKFAMEESMKKESLEVRLKHLEERMRIINSKKYKGSSEKTHADQLDLGLFNEPEQIQEEGETGEPTQDEIAPRKRTKTKGKKTAWVDTLPTEVIDYTLSPEEQVCPECGGPLHDMSKDIRCEIEIIPAKAMVTKHVGHIYSCRNCDKNAEAVPIIKAESPPALIKGSSASASAVAHIIHGKYVLANPLYRQETDLKKLVINLSRQTMSNWLIRVSQDYLKPLYDLMQEGLVLRDICHIDETPVQVIKEEGRTAQQESFMWVYRTAEEDDCGSIVLFDYQQGRGGVHPKAFMEGFKGYILTDGWSAYGSLIDKDTKPPPVIRVGCWSHARRFYDKALRGLGKEEIIATNHVQTGLDYCNKLFELERKWKDLSPDERLKKREDEAAPVVDEYFAWAKKTSDFAVGLLAKAVNYSLGQEECLRNYLRDGRLAISNNIAERSIRSFVIGRNNWLFAFTPLGAEASAIIYSIIETAKANGLNPGAYIEYLLTVMPGMNLSDKVALAKLLPWDESIPRGLLMPESTK
jgi:transposase